VAVSAAGSLGLVENIPEDPAERQAWLERWAAQQGERQAERRPLPRRWWKKTALTIELQAERLEQLLDRGLNTSRHVYDVPELAAVDGIVYLPTPWHVLPRALRAVRASSDDVLVDFGCGKGRVVHQAAKRPLRRVVGVEISQELADFARRLVAAHRHEYRCQDVEIAVGDAAQFEVPDDLTIAFMFDPFRGGIMDAVLNNLTSSIERNPRRVSLIYVNPTQGDRVLATGRFRLVKWQRGGLRDVRINRAAIFESVSS
jgi:SAM-dependent methyltransferase